MVAQFCKFRKIIELCIKCIHFMEYKLYLNKLEIKNQLMQLTTLIIKKQRNNLIKKWQKI